MRTGSKSGGGGGGGNGRNLSGSATPMANNSTMAIKGVSMNHTHSKRSSGGNGLSHPYASGSQGYDPNSSSAAVVTSAIGGGGGGDYASNHYTRSGQATPNNGMGSSTNDYLHPVTGQQQGGALHAEDEMREEKKFSFLRLFTCRCG